MNIGYSNLAEQAPCGEVAHMVGEGRSAKIFRYDSQPGYVYKFRHEGMGDDVEALYREAGRHAVLLTLDVNTLASYDVVPCASQGEEDTELRYCGRMPDLTDRGRKFVFSVQDAFRYQNEYGVPFPLGTGLAGSVTNGDAFFAELAIMIERTSQARINVNGADINGIKIEVPGMFLVAEQSGLNKVTVQTVVADFHDGQTFNTEHRTEPEFNENDPEYYSAVESYLRWVVKFFPELTEQAGHFIKERTGK